MLRRCLFLSCLAVAVAGAQPDGFNYDESKVPQFELPDPLVARDGTKIDSAEGWREKRRPEIQALFEDHVYGHTPAVDLETHAEVFEESDDALDGTAIRKQVRIFFSPKPSMGRSMDLLLYLPKNAAGPVPTFLGLNFQGNYTTQPDPAIRVTPSWVRNRNGIEDHRADPELRGVAASRWPAKEIVARGYGMATIYYGDIDPDYDDGFRNGVHELFPKNQDGDFSTIAAWSWGLSRALDYLEQDPQVDASKVAVIGHSRLGKTSLWAGATDERFALVISNDSGCGGAALSRRRFGETVARINDSFPHWFADSFNGYNGNEDELPVDQHMLLALVAPRPLYVASASEDLWADPRGEFLSLREAGPVYELLGKKGIGIDEPPPVGQSVTTDVGYHIRAGKHDITLEDWNHYMDFADKHLR